MASGLGALGGGRFPSDEPEIEIIRSVELPKMSPKRRHARLQWQFAMLLDSWAGDSGEVGSEWRFYLSREPGAETSLVPDVAFVSKRRLEPLNDEEAEEPPFAPDVVVEIRSPGDRDRNVLTKVRLYLAAGSQLVLDVDAAQRRIVAYAKSGERMFAEGETFWHPAAPGLSFDVAAMFAKGDRKRD